MKIAKLILLTAAMAILSICIIPCSANGETYIRFECISTNTDLAIYRAICDDDADSEGFMHGTLRIVIPGDPINPDQLGCVKERNERAYTCIGVPPETPGAPSYIWVFESN